METEIKQKEKWAAIGELSANIAHEIRNPIASLKGVSGNAERKYRDRGA